MIFKCWGMCEIRALSKFQALSNSKPPRHEKFYHYTNYVPGSQYRSWSLGNEGRVQLKLQIHVGLGLLVGITFFLHALPRSPRPFLIYRPRISIGDDGGARLASPAFLAGILRIGGGAKSRRLRTTRLKGEGKIRKKVQ